MAYDATPVPQANRRHKATQPSFEDVAHDLDTSLVTVPDKDTSMVVTDFAILKVKATPLAKEVTEARHGRYRIEGLKVALLIELKRPPKRSGSVEEQDSARNTLLSEAIDDLDTQSAYVFLTEPGTSSVMAIAGAGDRWQWTTYHREMRLQEEYDNYSYRDRLYLDPGSNLEPVHTVWSSPMILETTASNEEFEAIRQLLKELAV